MVFISDMLRHSWYNTCVCDRGEEEEHTVNSYASKNCMEPDDFFLQENVFYYFIIEWL